MWFNQRGKATWKFAWPALERLAMLQRPTFWIHSGMDYPNHAGGSILYVCQRSLRMWVSVLMIFSNQCGLFYRLCIWTLLPRTLHFKQSSVNRRCFLDCEWWNERAQINSVFLVSWNRALDAFLLPDDNDAVQSYLNHLSAEREKKVQEQEESGDKKDKHPSWIQLHMNQAEKRYLIALDHRIDNWQLIWFRFLWFYFLLIWYDSMLPMFRYWWRDVIVSNLYSLRDYC